MRNKILIVDDTELWRSFHSGVITELYGKLFEITYAASAKEGLNLIKQNLEFPFAVIITDLQMESDFEPKLAGEWLIENIRQVKEYDMTRIVIISAMYNIEKIAQKHNVDCISKNMLIHNKLLLKYMFEKLMPFLEKI